MTLDNMTVIVTVLVTTVVSACSSWSTCTKGEMCFCGYQWTFTSWFAMKSYCFCATVSWGILILVRLSMDNSGLEIRYSKRMMCQHILDWMWVSFAVFHDSCTSGATQGLFWGSPFVLLIGLELMYAQHNSSVSDKRAEKHKACIPENWLLWYRVLLYRWWHTETVLRLTFCTVGLVLNQCVPKAECCTVVVLKS